MKKKKKKKKKKCVRVLTPPRQGWLTGTIEPARHTPTSACPALGGRTLLSDILLPGPPHLHIHIHKHFHYISKTIYILKPFFSNNLIFYIN